MARFTDAEANTPTPVEGGFTRACIRLDDARDGEIRRPLGDDRRLVCLQYNLVRKSRVCIYIVCGRGFVSQVSTHGDFINPIVKICHKRERDLWDIFGRNPSLVFKAADS